jgi:hypothetical protein
MSSIIKQSFLPFKKPLDYEKAIRKAEGLLDKFQEVAFFYDSKKKEEAHITYFYTSTEKGIMKRIRSRRSHPDGLTIVKREKGIYNHFNLWGGLGKILNIISYNGKRIFSEASDSLDLRFVNRTDIEFIRRLFEIIGEISILKSGIKYLKERMDGDSRIDWGFNKILTLLKIGDKSEPFFSINNRGYGKRLFTPSIKYSMSIKEALFISKEKRKDTFFHFQKENPKKISEIKIGKYNPFVEKESNGIFIGHYIDGDHPFYFTYNDLISGLGNFLKVGCYSAKDNRFLIEGLDLRLKDEENIDKIKECFLMVNKSSIIELINSSNKGGSLINSLEEKEEAFYKFWKERPIKETLPNTLSLINNKILLQNTLLDF